jgi:hypothetical protein
MQNKYNDDIKLIDTVKIVKKYIKNNKYVFLTIILVMAISIVGTWHYTNTYHAVNSAADLLNQEKAYISDHDWIVYEPSQPTDQGFIIYPGGNVEAKAYLPLAKQISELGFKSIVASMPFNLAVFNSDVATNIFYKYDNIRDWYIAGHSLGGVMAAKYADLHPSKVEGLILMAAYPQDVSDISQTNLPVLSITATKDKILNQKRYRETKKLLPPTTQYVEIKGGNHSQFGSYGFQKGDGQATINQKKQLEKIVNYIKDFVSSTETAQ